LALYCTKTIIMSPKSQSTSQVSGTSRLSRTAKRPPMATTERGERFWQAQRSMSM
jgi:hypothetical protein